MSQGPVAVITNYHKLRGLYQQKFILSQLWRSEVKVLAESTPSKVPRGDSIPSLFQLLVPPGNLAL